MSSREERIAALDTMYVDDKDELVNHPVKHILEKAGWSPKDIELRQVIVVGNVFVIHSTRKKFLAGRLRDYGWAPTTGGSMEKQWLDRLLPYADMEENEVTIGKFNGTLKAFALYCHEEKDKIMGED